MNFEQARINMVDSQIHPMGVVSEAVLDAFRTLPREKFVSPDKRAIAYNDEDLPVGEGRWLMEPQVLARLVQACGPKQTDVVMVVGAGCGYAAGIFAHLVTTVIAVDESGPMVDTANQAWQELGLHNIVALEGDFGGGSAEHGPYDLIFINGAVADVPHTLKLQMSVGGRLVAVLRPDERGTGKASLILRTSEDNWSARTLFDANTPYLPRMAPRKSFVF